MVQLQVQLLSNEVLMEKLTEQLQEYCNNTPSPYASVSDLTNTHCQYCAVKHNGQWCRGKLLNIKEQVIINSTGHYVFCYTLGYSSDINRLWS